MLKIRPLRQWTDAGVFPELDSVVTTGSDYQSAHYRIFSLAEFLNMLSASLLLLFVDYARSIIFRRVHTYVR